MLWLLFRVEVMARPVKKEITKKHDKIIAKVYMQCYRWGFSSNAFEEIVSRAAYYTLKRGRVEGIGNGGFMSEEDMLSCEAIKKLYEEYCKSIDSKPYFKRSNYLKNCLQRVAPKQEHLYEVVCFFMEYMTHEKERCIFENPPEIPNEHTNKGIWWRFYNGELDGDPELSKKPFERLNNQPKIKLKNPPSR